MISIVIPCYNCEKFIGRAVKSVLNQSFTDWEILLIDNNSIDNTADLLKKFSADYPGKIFNFFEARRGAPAARNHGLMKAKGDWIQFLDADDELLPGKLERQWALATSSDASIVSGAYNFVTENNLHKAELREPFQGDSWSGLIQSKFGRTSSNLYNRLKVVQVNGWDESLTSSQEYNLLFNLMSAGGKIVLDSVPSCNIYAEVNSVSRPGSIESKIKVFDNSIKLRLRIREFLKTSGLWSPSREKTFNKSVYETLMRKRLIAKNEAKLLLKQLDLKVPLSVFLTSGAKYYTKNILCSLGLWKRY